MYAGVKFDHPVCLSLVLGASKGSTAANRDKRLSGTEPEGADAPGNVRTARIMICSQSVCIHMYVRGRSGKETRFYFWQAFYWRRATGREADRLRYIVHGRVIDVPVVWWRRPFPVLSLLLV